MRLYTFALTFVATHFLVFAPAYAQDTTAKLSGPVTEFIRSAQIRHLRFSADGSKKIGFVTWRGTAQRAPLVIVPGRSEVAFLWAETAFDLRQRGFDGDIFVWDPPGQGLSDRLLPDQPGAGHIGKFTDYSDNLVVFLRKVHAESGFKPDVLAHSMGGAISVLAFEEAGDIAGQLILVTPMLDIRFGPGLVDTGVHIFMQTLRQTGLFQTHAMGGAGGDPHTSDQERLAFRQNIHQQYNSELPGKTLGWIAESNRGIDQALKNAGKIKNPILMFVAGADGIIEPNGARTLAETCKNNCQLIEIPGARHAVHEEKNQYREVFIEATAKALGLQTGSCYLPLLPAP